MIAVAALAVASALPLFGDERPAAEERLARYAAELKQEDESIRSQAEKRLMREDTKFLKVAVQMSREPRKRGTALLILSRMGAAGVEGLLELLTDPELGLAAASALSTVVSPADVDRIPALLKCLQSLPWGNYCGVALVKAASPKARRHASGLIEALSGEKTEVRAFAAAALGEIGPKAKAAVPELQKALNDEAESLRLAAVVALGKIGTKAEIALPAVEDATKDGSAEVRREAREALKKIKG